MSITFAAMVPHPPLIVPAVGGGDEQRISATVESYRKVAARIAELRPDTVIISSPHSVMYYDYFHISPGKQAWGDFQDYSVSPLDWSIKVKYDSEFVDTLVDYAEQLNFPAGTEGERDPALDHGTMIPLHFLREAYGDTPLPQVVRIGLSGLPLSYHYMLGMLIKQAAEELDRNVVYIASGDLSHKLKAEGPYGYEKEGPEYDRRIMDVMGAGDFGKLFDFSGDFCDRAAECGHRSFVMMAGALDRTAVKAERLSHEGPFGVGYGVCTFEPEGPDDTRNFLEQEEGQKAAKVAALREKEDVYLILARTALEHYLKEGYVPSIETMQSQGLIPELPTDLTERKAGAFVSLHKEGALRGCIGTTGPTRENLAEEICSNVVKAATEDPRFPNVQAHELPDLVYDVDILSEPEEISGPEELDVKKYGVIVETDGFIPKRGLLLPDLAGVDTVEEQIAIACQKANLQQGEKYFLQRFTVERHCVEEE